MPVIDERVAVCRRCENDTFEVRFTKVGHTHKMILRCDRCKSDTVVHQQNKEISLE